MAAYHEEELPAYAELPQELWDEYFEYVGIDPDDGLPLWRPRWGLGEPD